MKKYLYTLFFLFSVTTCSTVLLSGCSTSPPDHIENICSMFRQYPEWYWTARDIRKNQKLPISVLMAIIYQESRFRSDAAPPRERLLWIIPWKRPTTAYGYSQALDGTWKRYQQDTGNKHARRSAFDDAADFIGWFANRAHQRAGIAKTNAYALYLAYHEGIGGYQQRTYIKKRWLIHVAWKVQRRANTYRAQLLRCEKSLPQKPWWHLW